VVACDIKPLEGGSEPFELADATQRETLQAIIRRHRIGSIYHLVSILSAAGEKNPSLGWSVNIESFAGPPVLRPPVASALARASRPLLHGHPARVRFP
jgi:hypothetical protein